jgi:hypothetical protein
MKISARDAIIEAARTYVRAEEEARRGGYAGVLGAYHALAAEVGRLEEKYREWEAKADAMGALARELARSKARVAVGAVPGVRGLKTRRPEMGVKVTVIGVPPFVFPTAIGWRRIEGEHGGWEIVKEDEDGGGTSQIAWFPHSFAVCLEKV